MVSLVHRMRTSIFLVVAMAGSLVLGAAPHAHAGTVAVTIENLAPNNGFVPDAVLGRVPRRHI